MVATSANGKVIDYHVMSKYCRSCAIWERKTGTDEYNEWKAAHVCKINHKASSGAMEANGAIEIFHRSIQAKKLRYIDYIGDDDTRVV